MADLVAICLICDECECAGLASHCPEFLDCRGKTGAIGNDQGLAGRVDFLKAGCAGCSGKCSQQEEAKEEPGQICKA